ncbi:MAG: hypothetical protein HY907_01630, partial [Deltaproteobacteria bacterium]|nr:hypothetical protein [Deltaproteobacteria bacterium]
MVRRTIQGWAAAAILALPGCTEANPFYQAPDAEADVPGVEGDARVDVAADADSPADGDADGEADLSAEADAETDAEADAGPCTAGTTRCTGTTLETCEAGGTWLARPCINGCLETGGPHCGVLAPSNLPERVLGAGTGSLGPSAWSGRPDTLDIDTDTGEITAGRDTVRPAGEGLDPDSGIHFRVVAQSGGAPSIGVFAVGDAEIPDNMTAWVTGDNAFALVATGAVVVRGTFNCKAWFESTGGPKHPGPGGGAPGAGPGAGAGGIEDAADGMLDGGGGGASFGGQGAAGGYGTIGGAAGTSYGDPSLVPLWGGSGGGDGWDNPGEGGPGGGACQLVSALSIVVLAGAGLDAAGHGGDGAGARGGGGGGGSGGGLLLEAPRVTVAGTLAANGGGGGAGAESTTLGGAGGQLL